MSLRHDTSKHRKSDQGFGLIEALIATVILVVGLTALAGLFAQSLTALQSTREDLVAKQKAMEALEGVYSARDDASVGFAAIQNRSAGGIFNDGFQPLFVPGANGIVGTTSDTQTIQSEVSPGPDGVLGDADDIVIPLVNYQRQIRIQQVINPDGSVSSDLRQITVTIRVASSRIGVRDYNVTGYISRYQ
ncbi:MAG TPA: prepilin-type N-terminal cleavage/methylation domain-containing protein [Candidatus Dormibacteraeota bacterium]|nr:prepilin-type N-terminal cleavage/methylation domain-containing protein [Candidatus Dormibacteraeota bacterium]